MGMEKVFGLCYVFLHYRLSFFCCCYVFLGVGLVSSLVFLWFFCVFVCGYFLGS